MERGLYLDFDCINIKENIKEIKFINRKINKTNDTSAKTLLNLDKNEINELNKKIKVFGKITVDKIFIFKNL